MSTTTDTRIVDKVRPIGDHLLVKILDENDMTPGGLALPQSASNKGVKRAQVIACGPGVMLASGERKPIEADPGDEVWFRRGQLGNEEVLCEVELDGEPYLILPESILLFAKDLE